MSERGDRTPGVPHRRRRAARRARRRPGARLPRRHAHAASSSRRAGADAARREGARAASATAHRARQCLDIDHQRERAVRRTNYLSDLRQDILYALRSMRQNVGLHRRSAAHARPRHRREHRRRSRSSTRCCCARCRCRTRSSSSPSAIRRAPAVCPRARPRNDLASYPLFADVREQTRTLSGIYASGRATGSTCSADEAQKEPEHPRGRFVSANYFSVLQVPAALGRTFSPDEDRGRRRCSRGRHQLRRTGMTRFGGDRSAVGRTIPLNGVPLTIIGVAPRTFTGRHRGAAHGPLDADHGAARRSCRTRRCSRIETSAGLLLMGRLAPGVSLAQARDELTALEIALAARARPARAIVRVSSRTARDKPMQVESGARGFSYYRAPARGPALHPHGRGGRGAAHRLRESRESHARARRGARPRDERAHGARRQPDPARAAAAHRERSLRPGRRRARACSWRSGGARRCIALDRRRSSCDASLDGRVLAFTAVLVARDGDPLRPRRRRFAARVWSWRRHFARRAAECRARERGTGKFGLGKMLVVAQVALSVLLLVGTGMLVRSMQRLQTHRHRRRARSTAARRSRRGARGLQGRAAADADARAHGTRAARRPAWWLRRSRRTGSSPEPNRRRMCRSKASRHSRTRTAASPTTMWGPRTSARSAHTWCRAATSRSVTTNPAARSPYSTRLLARFFFPHGQCARRTHLLGQLDVRDRRRRSGRGRTGSARKAQPARLFPGISDSSNSGKILVSRCVLPAIRRAWASRSGARCPPPTRRLSLHVEPLTDLIQDSIAQDKLVARVVSVFGILALALAALGLYGVMTYATTRRTSEFGLRMALGAEPGDVIATRARRGDAARRGRRDGRACRRRSARCSWCEHQLYEVGLLDWPSILVALVVLGASAALAGYVPARRAARVGPLVALRDA